MTVVKLKQPLRLADNLSAFDPESPLSVSDTMQVRLSIPIADTSPANDRNVSRGKLVTGIPGRQHIPLFDSSTNVEHLSFVFEDNGWRIWATFAQEVSAVWWTFTSIEPTNVCVYDIPVHDEWIGYTLRNGEGRLLRHRKTTWLFTAYGTLPVGTMYITGFF